jgi:hypothetical protein
LEKQAAEFAENLESQGQTGRHVRRSVGVIDPRGMGDGEVGSTGLFRCRSGEMAENSVKPLIFAHL